jgi:hypothetical protein
VNLTTYATHAIFDSLELDLVHKQFMLVIIVSGFDSYRLPFLNHIILELVKLDIDQHPH